ncbi:MAG: hypothetical protein ABRQ39_26975 [Candidatus Eremiobacterota bacterium]
MKILGKMLDKIGLTDSQNVKTSQKVKEETLFADNDKVTLSENSDAEDVTFSIKVPNGNIYTKEQALFDLMRVESSADDAQDDLIVIEDNMKKNETLKEATGQFIRILNYCGVNCTSSAQQNFIDIGDTLREKQNEVRKDAVDLYMALGRAEQDTAQGMDDYLFINKYVDEKRSRKEMTEQFINLLNFVGINQTGYVQEYYSEIEKCILTDENRQSALNLYMDLARTEQCTEQAMDDYLFINKYISKEKNREECTAQFIRILDMVGIKNTSDAMDMFSQLNGRG